MPRFDIVKANHPKNTFRVAKIESDFDVKPEHSCEHFTGEITMPDAWQIGAIIGGSGTGKSTIARELFADDFITQFEYTRESVSTICLARPWTK